MNLTKTRTGLLSDNGKFYQFAESYVYFPTTGYESISDDQCLFETADGIVVMDLTMIIDGITFKSIPELMTYVTTPVLI